MNEQLTFEDLRAYQAGLLSNQERHRVERILIEDPFYADALSGLEAMQTTATPTADQLATLRNALDKRIRASATKKRLWPLWIATTTAAILFVLAVAIYFIFFAPKQTPKPRPVTGVETTMNLNKSPGYWEGLRFATLTGIPTNTGSSQEPLAL